MNMRIRPGAGTATARRARDASKLPSSYCTRPGPAALRSQKMRSRRTAQPGRGGQVTQGEPSSTYSTSSIEPSQDARPAAAVHDLNGERESIRYLTRRSKKVYERPSESRRLRSAGQRP